MSAESRTPTEHLAWLLGCLDSAVECLDWCGRDVDARIVEAHRAELAAGREWPGQPVVCPPEFDAESDPTQGTTWGISV